MASDAEEFAIRLKRIGSLTDRLRLVQADSVSAQELNTRIQQETALLKPPPATPPNPHK
jgi:hypothetical protein